MGHCFGWNSGGGLSVTINYLLGNLGKGYENTVGVVDLGGGSVQMAYAISEADALTAPKLTDGEDTYVKELFLKGTKYFLYVHSYMNFGLLAARAEILKTDDDPASSCILAGYNGKFSISVFTFFVKSKIKTTIKLQMLVIYISLIA